MSTGSPTATAVGAALTEMVIESVDAEKMKTMAVILRDPNPIHWDVELVRQLGMGDKVVNQGPNNMAYLVELLARHWQGEEHLRSLKVRFSSNVFAGDRLVAGGEVTAVTDDGGRRTATCSVWLRRDGDPQDTVMSGEATIALA